MEPLEYLSTLRRRWVMIVAIALIGAVAGLVYASSLPRLYRSTSSVFVASERGATTSELVQGSTFTQDQVESYAQLAALPEVLNPVIEDLGLDTTASALAGSVTADIRLNTVIIDITVTSRSPERAAAIAKAVTDSLADVAEELAPEGSDQLPAITLKTVASASVPNAPASPNIRLLVVTGFGIGLILAIAYALGREVLDTRVRTEKDFQQVTTDPVLGKISRTKGKDSSKIVMVSDPYGSGAESFRRLGTNLEFADVDNPVRSVVVTSALPAEGKTTTSINLAIALSERLKRVLVIDCDLRKPSVAEYLKIEGSVGLTSVLVGSATVDQAIVPWAGGRIDVLPAGVVLANPAQLVGSDAMANLIGDLISQYNFVVIDSPPLLPVTDSLTLARLTDGAVVVAKYKTTRRQRLAEALESLEAVSARVIGLVLNGVPAPKHQAYYGYEAPAVARATAELSDPVEKIGVAHEQGGDPSVSQKRSVVTSVDGEFDETLARTGEPAETRSESATPVPDGVIADTDVDTPEAHVRRLDDSIHANAGGDGDADAGPGGESKNTAATDQVPSGSGVGGAIRPAERQNRPAKAKRVVTSGRPPRGPSVN